MAEHDHPGGCRGCEGLLVDAERARAIAEGAARAKDDFFLTLSHELRGPLNAIKSWVYLLRSGQLDGKDVARALETIDRNVNAEARLITDMLDVSRIIAGQLRIERLPVDLAGLVAESADTVRPSADARGIHMETQCEITDGLVAADPTRLRQVVENLMVNAIKFTPTGGRVDVRVAYDANVATIAVSDTGRGIPSDLLPHVFERFRQGTPEPGHLSGLGLGLAIVQHLVGLHGGSVAATSAGEGRGATFTVTLPVTHTEDGAAPSRGDVRPVAP